MPAEDFLAITHHGANGITVVGLVGDCNVPLPHRILARCMADGHHREVEQVGAIGRGWHVEIQVAQGGMDRGADIALDRIQGTRTAGVGHAFGVAFDGRDVLPVVVNRDGEAVVGIFQRAIYATIALFKTNPAPVSASAIIRVARVIRQGHGCLLKGGQV